MEAEVKNNVTTKQTNHHRKEKKKCTKYEFSLEGKTVDSLIISHGFEVCHIEIALLKLKRKKKYLHTRIGSTQILWQPFSWNICFHVEILKQTRDQQEAATYAQHVKTHTVNPLLSSPPPSNKPPSL